MFIPISVIVLVAGIILFFPLNQKVSGAVTFAVGLLMLGVHIPVLSPIYQQVSGLF